MFNETQKKIITDTFNMEIDDAVNHIFRHYQRQMDIEDGMEPFDTRINELQKELAAECTRVLEFQLPEDHETERECIVDYADEDHENTDLSDVISKLSELFNFNTEAGPIVVQIVSYRAGTWHAPEYEMTNDLYEWLNEYIQCVDCKNGTQIYKDNDGYYFCITGSCWTNSETGIGGTDEIHLKFRNFEW